MNSIRLLVVEDHSIVREGLMNVLSAYPDICIVAEAADGAGMINKYFEVKPDIVLSDVNMPGMEGTTAAKEILSRDESARIIFLTMYKSEEYIYKCLKAGAMGMVSKDVIKHELVYVIRKVFNGERYIMGMTNVELNTIKLKYEKIEEAEKEDIVHQLSNREKMILELIAKGLKSAEIAEQLNVSKRSIDSWRSVLMDKLDVQSLPQLIKRAVEITFKNNNNDKEEI